MAEPLLLIDGDILLYNATLASEEEVQWDDDTHVLSSNYQDAKRGFLSQIEFYQNKLNTEKVRIAFTQDKGDLFRYQLYPDYKANRVSKRKPLCFARLRDEMATMFSTLTLQGLEADDILGIWATRDTKHDYIIVSADKDLKTIPGKLWRENKLHEITEYQANNFWLMQTLMGDVTDGYPGCPGIGKVKATKALTIGVNVNDRLELFWARVVEVYEDAGLTAEDALVQARLARILRASDWDAKRKQPILWEPPK